MKRADFDRLRKFMKLTQSENDAEALSAIRMANRVIERAEVTWDRFFDRAVRVEVEDASAYGERARGEEVGRRRGPITDVAEEPLGDDPGYGHDEPAGYPEQEAPPENDGRPAKRMLDPEREAELVRVTQEFAVIEEVGVDDPGAKKFIDSLKAQWKRKGELSEKQGAALTKFATTARKFKERGGYR